MAAVLVFVETQDGSLKKSAPEVLGQAAQLAGDLGGGVDAVLVGQGAGALAESVGNFGVDKVYVAEADSLANFSIEAFTKPLLKAVAAATPKLVLFAASVNGKDLAPAVAAATGSAILTDVTEIGVKDGAISVTKPVYAGKALAEVSASSDTVVATLRPNVFEPVEPAGGSATVESLDTSDIGDLRATVKEVLAKASEKLDLTEADVIVAGGRGLKGPENWHLIEQLAEAVGGVTGASRAVVDAGWRPHDEQVGQTGKTVSPKLYIAVGVSGAIQHLAGMRTSKCIVAINTDAEAPIFKVADYGIVGDAFEVCPVLAEELAKLRA
ncbi:MAG: electron transfer flavoprotein subunit alpha/FixB family protein [Planctomycetota bacterium]